MGLFPLGSVYCLVKFAGGGGVTHFQPFFCHVSIIIQICFILFLVHINDIQKCTSLDVLRFADDTTSISSSNDIKGLYDKINFELGELIE